MTEQPNIALEARLSTQLLVGEVLSRNAQKFPDHEAFVIGHRSFPGYR
jgi:hypothetical protein